MRPNEGEEREEKLRILLELGRGPSTSSSHSHALSKVLPPPTWIKWGSPFFGMWRRELLMDPPMRALPFPIPFSLYVDDKSLPILSRNKAFGNLEL